MTGKNTISEMIQLIKEIAEEGLYNAPDIYQRKASRLARELGDSDLSVHEQHLCGSDCVYCSIEGEGE